MCEVFYTHGYTRSASTEWQECIHQPDSVLWSGNSRPRLMTYCQVHTADTDKTRTSCHHVENDSFRKIITKTTQRRCAVFAILSPLGRSYKHLTLMNYPMPSAIQHTLPLTRLALPYIFNITVNAVIFNSQTVFFASCRVLDSEHVSRAWAAKHTISFSPCSALRSRSFVFCHARLPRSRSYTAHMLCWVCSWCRITWRLMPISHRRHG